MSLKTKLLKTLFREPFLKKNVIILESCPDFDGNPMMLEREIERQFPDKYHFFWAVDKHCEKKTTERTIAFWGGLSLFEKIRKYYYLAKTKLILDSNRPVLKFNPETLRVYTRHGGTFKKCDKYLHSVGEADYILTLSDSLADIDFGVMNGFSVSRREQILPLGYPLHDILFEDFDLYRCGLLKEPRYQKIVGWLPTFRQHKNNDSSISLETAKEFSLPLIENVEDFNRINDIFASKNSLLIVQLHHSQISSLPAKTYSNILFLTQEQKDKYGIKNMNLLHCFDAMITDYSGAYYEFLLLDRPIALTIDDYEEYATKIGFYIDYQRLVQGERLSKIEDLEVFVNHVVSGEDVCRDKRASILPLVHNFPDNQSSRRIVDFINSKIDL